MCIAQRIKNSCEFNTVEIYKLCLKNKRLLKKHVTKNNTFSRYDAFVFTDNSRLTFKLCDGNLDLIVWHYYNAPSWRKYNV